MKCRAICHHEISLTGIYESGSRNESGQRMHNDIYLALLALACAVFVYAAIGRHQPASVVLVPLGLAVWVLAIFCRSAGWI